MVNKEIYCQKQASSMGYWHENYYNRKHLYTGKPIILFKVEIWGIHAAQKQRDIGQVFYKRILCIPFTANYTLTLLTWITQTLKCV
jgi:hypothetical protein